MLNSWHGHPARAFVSNCTCGTPVPRCAKKHPLLHRISSLVIPQVRDEKMCINLRRLARDEDMGETPMPPQKPFLTLPPSGWLWTHQFHDISFRARCIEKHITAPACPRSPLAPSILFAAGGSRRLGRSGAMRPRRRSSGGGGRRLRCGRIRSRLFPPSPSAGPGI